MVDAEASEVRGSGSCRSSSRRRALHAADLPPPTPACHLLAPLPRQDGLIRLIRVRYLVGGRTLTIRLPTGASAVELKAHIACSENLSVENLILVSNATVLRNADAIADTDGPLLLILAAASQGTAHILPALLLLLLLAAQLLLPGSQWSWTCAPRRRPRARPAPPLPAVTRLLSPFSSASCVRTRARCWRLRRSCACAFAAPTRPASRPAAAPASIMSWHWPSPPTRACSERGCSCWRRWP